MSVQILSAPESEVRDAACLCIHSFLAILTLRSNVDRYLFLGPLFYLFPFDFPFGRIAWSF